MWSSFGPNSFNDFIFQFRFFSRALIAKMIYDRHRKGFSSHVQFSDHVFQLLLVFGGWSREKLLFIGRWFLHSLLKRQKGEDQHLELKCWICALDIPRSLKFSYLRRAYVFENRYQHIFLWIEFLHKLFLFQNLYH